MHAIDGGLAVRALRPDAAAVNVIERCGAAAVYPATRMHADGLFEAIIADRDVHFSYELEIEDYEGHTYRVRDPYSFWTQFSTQDQYLFNEGTHHRAYEALGAHPRWVDGTYGTYFAVWAPSAWRVSVVGDFNRWDGRLHAMRPLRSSGLWEIFAPEVGEGSIYKYEILSREGDIMLKADPFAFAAEEPPRTASVIRSLADFAWGDEEWMAAREERDWRAEPLAIYEVHLGSWRRTDALPLDYRELAHQLVAHVLELGFTHIELMPVAEHPFDG